MFPSKIDGKYEFHIILNLGSNRDVPGTLKLYTPDGSLKFGPVQALGRGTNHETNGYDHTNQLRRNADTPSGVAEIKLHNKSPNINAFGDMERLHLYKGISGNFLEAERRGRSEILIHGGLQRNDKTRPWYPLHPTHGCIRLLNDDMRKLVKIVRQLGGVGKITII